MFPKLFVKTDMIPWTPTGTGWQKIWLKDETQQNTRAFKIRGVSKKLQHLIEEEGPINGVVTASTGNHGLAVSFAARALGIPCRIFIPAKTCRAKADRIQQFGANTTIVNGDYDLCHQLAVDFAKTQQRHYISSFDDRHIIRGHQELVQEVLEEAPHIDTLFAPVGGGGLISACIEGMKDNFSCEVVGAEAETFPALTRSLDENRLIEFDQVSGPAEGLLVRKIGKIPFEICSVYQPHVMPLSDNAIKEAVAILWTELGIRAEFAGAASLAAALNYGNPGKECACIISGGNIDEDLFQQALQSLEVSKL